MQVNETVKTLLDKALELRKEIKQSRTTYVWGTNAMTAIHISTIDEKGEFKDVFNYKVDAQTLSETLGILSPSIFGLIAEKSNCGEKCSEILQKGNDAYSFVSFDLEMEYGDGVVDIDLSDIQNEGITLLQFLLPFAAYGLTYGEIQPQIDKFCDGDKDLAGRFELLDKDSKILGGCIYE